MSKDYFLFEDFEIPLLDFMVSKRYLEKNDFDLDQARLSKLILEFHRKFESKKLSYFFHTS